MNLIEAHHAISHLVVASSGNVSRRFLTGMEIKPSGVPCSVVQDTVFVRLSDGRHNLKMKPSTDSETHRYIYNHLPDINAIVHTHSTYATAYAVAGYPIPCIATAIADEFGGDIPVSAYCDIGTDAIGKEVVHLYEITYSPAILIRQHGVFTVGKTIEAAVKAAIMVEDCAKTAWHARQLGACFRLETAEIKANHSRYQGSYGQ